NVTFETFRAIHPEATHVAVAELGDNVGAIGFGTEAQMQAAAAVVPRGAVGRAFAGRVSGGVGVTPESYVAKFKVGDKTFATQIPRTRVPEIIPPEQNYSTTARPHPDEYVNPLAHSPSEAPTQPGIVAAPRNAGTASAAQPRHTELRQNANL